MMMKRTIWIIGALLPLFLACEHSDQEQDTRELSYTLEVANENYTAPTVLDGLGDVQITRISGQPDWVTSISRQEELYEGKLVLDVTVESEKNMRRNRSADIVLSMSSGATATLSLTQRPGLFSTGFQSGESASLNKDFEEDWSSQLTIKLIKSVVYINDVPEVKHEEVALPWNGNAAGVKNHFAEAELRKMMLNKYDWALAFNTTGIPDASGVNLNYFGLFNRYTHVLRVFYYWPQELLPPSGANDHMWHVTFTGKTAEYHPTSFAVPYNHTLEGSAASRFQQYANTYYTTPLTDDMAVGGEALVVPAAGWWAFDMDMSAMRQQSFFDGYNEYNRMTIGMDLFDMQNLVLKSYMDGVGIGGDFNGNMNLEGLVAASADAAGKIVPGILGPAGNMAQNTYLLQCINEGTAFGKGAIITSALGTLACIVGNLVGALSDDAPDDAETIRSELGNIDASLNLHMSGTINTEGVIKSQRSHGVPSVSVPLSFMGKIRGNKNFQMGRGIWNIENNPVVYVVKDAFWSNKAVLSYFTRKQQSWYRAGSDVAEYEIYSSPTSLGLRLISFFDPTSIGDVILNEDVFGTISDISVGASYGVYPCGVAGNTDAFRSAVGLDYDKEVLSLATADKDQTASTGNVSGAKPLPLKIFKDPYTKDFFRVELDEDDKETFGDLIDARLSSQSVNGDYERRYFGNSLYFTNRNADASTVDVVQFVSDPQIFVPFNEKKRVITDPDLPDLVVTVQLRVKSLSPGQEEPSVKVYRLRYLPRIEFINAEDVPALYRQMAAKINGDMQARFKNGTSDANYQTLQAHLDLVKAYAEAISNQLSE